VAADHNALVGLVAVAIVSQDMGGSHLDGRSGVRHSWSGGFSGVGGSRSRVALGGSCVGHSWSRSGGGVGGSWGRVRGSWGSIGHRWSRSSGGVAGLNWGGVGGNWSRGLYAVAGSWSGVGGHRGGGCSMAGGQVLARWQMADIGGHGGNEGAEQEEFLQ